MTAKEYLNQVRRNRLHCQILDERIKELKAQAQGLKAIVYDKDRVQVSPTNKLEEYTVKIVALEDKQSKALWKFDELEETIRRQVMQMPSDTHREILTLRYIKSETDGRRITFERIACIMHKSFDWVRHAHGQALREFERRYL